ncbi:low-specificity L-threonine aldolase [Oryzomonas japonica]|uniref:low-specificity L-threonine aldolase n=1 Tax=Oryzomonas japonica TaxID=2603858 RepID=UPI001C3FA15C
MTGHIIDLRSDTVTRPGPGMRAAMMDAQVGDDVWGDDPTVNRLQDVVAERSGKEAALFLPSGTQSNLAALMAHCERGDEYIVGQVAHTYKYEGGGAAVLGSIVPQPIENAADGTLPLDKVAAAIKHHGPGMGVHFARTRLLALEDTFNGQVLPADYIREAAALARDRGLAIHLDGARVCNAAVARHETLAQACAPFDSVSICFSKGLGAPVGSVLVGSRGFIERAHRWRKVLGGGMRQAGFLAAACLYALDYHFDRLAQDHANAEHLARGLGAVDQVTVTGQDTNMVFARFPEEACAPLQAYLAERGILVQVTPTTRLVTHLDVTVTDMDALVRAVKQYFSRG